MKTKTIKQTTVLGTGSIGGNYSVLWAFTWKTKKEREKWINYCQDHYKSCFLKFEDKIVKF